MKSCIFLDQRGECITEYKLNWTYMCVYIYIYAYLYKFSFIISV